MKAPSSNLQHPEKLQKPSFGNRVDCAGEFGVWDLEFLWSLELGIWSFRI
jgi:hypothetical protein